MHKLKYPDRISKELAFEKIAVYAKWGKDQKEPRPRTELEVKQLIINEGQDPDEFIELCRDYRKHIPFFESIGGGIWTVSKGATVRSVNMQTGDVGAEIHGPGQISLSHYQDAFIYAAEAKNKAVEDSSIYELHSAIVFGISAIETYLNFQAENWNKINLSNPQIDSLQTKVNLEEKIENWIPKICSGRTIKKDNHQWAHFKELKRIRDNRAIHPKSNTIGVKDQQLADMINKFRYGIGMLLGEIHLCFEDPIPSCIVNAIYYPDIQIIEAED